MEKTKYTTKEFAKEVATSVTKGYVQWYRDYLLNDFAFDDDFTYPLQPIKTWQEVTDGKQD